MKFLIDYCKGILIGSGAILPGISSGVFCVILGIYEKLIELGGGGATGIISNFGYMLYTGALEGFQEFGILGIFSGMLTKSSVAIVGSIIFASIVALIFKPKD